MLDYSPQVVKEKKKQDFREDDERARGPGEQGHKEQLDNYDKEAIARQS
jgi:hypothetical protein